MRVKLDENLPALLGVTLQRLGHDVRTVRDEGLSAEPDAAILRAAREEGRFLITQDLDFWIAGVSKRVRIRVCCSCGLPGRGGGH